MRLVRINDDMILNLDDVQFAIWEEDRKRVLIGFKSNENSVTTTNKKVLDAICSSEEHLVDEAVSEMLYKANSKLLEINQKLLSKIKNLNQ